MKIKIVVLILLLAASGWSQTILRIVPTSQRPRTNAPYAGWLIEFADTNSTPHTNWSSAYSDVLSNICFAATNVFSGTVWAAPKVLSYTNSTNVIVDFATANAFKLLVTTNTLLIPTNATAGDSTWYLKTIMSPAAGYTCTVAFTSNALNQKFLLPGGTPPTATTNVGAQDIYTLTRAYDGTNVAVLYNLDFK